MTGAHSPQTIRASTIYVNAIYYIYLKLYFHTIQLWKRTGAWFTHDIEPYTDQVRCYDVRKPQNECVLEESKEEHESADDFPLHTDSSSSVTSEADFPTEDSVATTVAYSTDESGLPICQIDELEVPSTIAYCREFNSAEDSSLLHSPASSQMVSRLRGKSNMNVLRQIAIDEDDGIFATKQATLERSASLPVESSQNEVDGRENTLSCSTISHDRDDKKGRKERHSFVKSLTLRPSKQGRMKS